MCIRDRPNINNPLSGSLAKVCTEFNIPDRTKKVPNKLNEKVKIANNAVHDLNVLFFSIISIECIRATESIHGIKDAFSTGSQNQ